MVALLAEILVAAALILLCFLTLITIHRAIKVDIIKYRLLALSAVCVSVHIVNDMIYISYTNGVSETIFSGMFMLFIYYNLILFWPFKLLDNKLKYWQVFVYLQGTFVVIYLSDIVITEGFFNMSYGPLVAHYWIKNAYVILRNLIYP